MTRAAGVLLPVTSLPSEYGVGCFDRSAYAFVDFLKGAGQRFWQILPLCPTSYGDSPYQSFSTFAGNPYFISLDALVAAGELTREECDGEDFGSDPACVDYHRLYRRRLPLLRRAADGHLAESPMLREGDGSLPKEKVCNGNKC